jgi:hypothetical protein
MLKAAKKTTSTGSVSFYVGGKLVIAVGSDYLARKTFFDSKGLSFIMG